MVLDCKYFNIFGDGRDFGVYSDFGTGLVLLAINCFYLFGNLERLISDSVMMDGISRHLEKER